MNLAYLIYYTRDIGDNNRAAKEGIQLTLQDPSGRTNTQIPIEMVSFTEEEGEEFVVISLILVEDAVWFKLDGFNIPIKLWTETIHNP